MAIRLTWQNERLTVTRLVYTKDHTFSALHDVLTEARGVGLDVADESTDPRPGDFWLGTLPGAGFGRVNPSAVGWASPHEVLVALGLIHDALGTAGPLRLDGASGSPPAPTFSASADSPIWIES